MIIPTLVHFSETTRLGITSPTEDRTSMITDTGGLVLNMGTVAEQDCLKCLPMQQNLYMTMMMKVNLLYGGD